MTRGNQREIDRKRAAIRKASYPGQGVKDKDGLNANQRKERDAAIMREKAKQAEEKKKGETQTK